MQSRRIYEKGSYEEGWYNWISYRKMNNQVDITREEWINWWKETGHWEERGKGRYNYCMVRYNRQLPFSLDNIVCVQHKDKGKYGT